MLANILIQPLSANDIVAIGAMIFGGTVLIIRAMKDKPTAADAKADALGDQVRNVTDQLAAMQKSITDIALHTPAPTKQLATTGKPIDQANTDTLPLGTPALK